MRAYAAFDERGRMSTPIAHTVSGATTEFQLPGLRSVARRALPNLIEANLVPTVLFIVLLQLSGLRVAALSSLAWSLLALGRRLLFHRRISALLLLALVGLTARTVVVLISGSPHIYFLQPIATTAVVGLIFLGSTLTATPIVHRLAGDFCPLPSEVTDRPRVRRLFQYLTLIWAGVNLGNACVTCWLLFTQNLTAFVALKSVTAMGLTWSAVGLTVAWSVQVARREGFRVHRVTPTALSPA